MTINKKKDEPFFQIKQEKNSSAELSSPNREIAFQHHEKEKREAELIIANNEPAVQNKEKEKSAAELSLANTELLFQNEEKEKRAAELNIANIELLFQNKEKEKRVIELSIANKELALQNEEKEKHAAELSALNKELTFKYEERLKEVSDYKYSLDESSILAITDQKGIIKYVNENFCKISKFSKEELIGQDHRIINSSHHPSEFIKNIWVTIANGKVWKGEIKNKAKDGAAYWVDTTIVPFLDENKKPFQYVAIRSDITERKKAEEEVTYREKEIVLNRISDGVISVDNDWRYTFLNEASLKTHPRSKEETIGQVIWDVHPEMKGTIFWDKYHEAMLTKKVVEIESYYAPMKTWFSAKVYPSSDGLTIFYKDVTERKKTEQTILELNEGLEKKIKERTEQLESANKEMESFSYSVAHDLRSPVRAMHGYATMLLEDYESKLDEEGKRLISEITYNSKTMGTLIDDLLTFSRLGRKEISKETIDMNQLTKASLAALNSGNTPKIIFSKLLSVTADPSLMKHVMTNLLSNAIKYSSKEEKPIIEIKTKEENGNIIYLVKDNGVGFDMAFADKLFGVFQRLHSDEEFEGTGVGLAIVQRIILRHGGKVWAEAKENEGATFYFSLPKIN